MSIKAAFTITNPFVLPFEVQKPLSLGTFKLNENWRVLAEITRPNTHQIVDISAVWLDKNETVNPGVYFTGSLFGFGISLTLYQV